MNLGMDFPRTLTTRLNFVLVLIYTPFVPRTPLSSGVHNLRGSLGSVLAYSGGERSSLSLFFLYASCSLVCMHTELSALYLVCLWGDIQESRPDWCQISLVLPPEAWNDQSTKLVKTEAPTDRFWTLLKVLQKELLGKLTIHFGLWAFTYIYFIYELFSLTNNLLCSRIICEKNIGGFMVS